MRLKSLIWSLLGPTTSNYNVAKILVISALVQAFFFLTAYYCIPGGALEFVHFGNALLSFLQGRPVAAPEAAARSVGYPLVLILSGFFQSGSMIGIAIIQGLMAIFMPVFIYFTVLPVSFAGAYYVALASIISLGPFLFAKWLHHDQTYIFFSIVTLWAFSGYVTSRRPLALLGLTLAVIATSFARPAGGLLFPVLIVVAYAIARGPIRPYAAAVFLFIVAGLGNHYLRDELFYLNSNKQANEYTGGQIFYDLYINSLDYGIRLSADLGPNMKEVTDRAYEAMLPNPRSSTFLQKLYNSEASSNSFQDQVVIPFLTKYFYPYSATEFSQQLYLVPNWEYYLVIINVVPDRVLLAASWEILKAHPFLPIAYTLRNLWYFLYKPGYFHTRFNPIPIFHGGLFYPLDGQVAIGTAFGTAFGAGASILGLPPRATRELAFDSFEAQPNWMKQGYVEVRRVWLASYDALARVMFFLILIAWGSMTVSGLAALSRNDKFQKWSTIANANRLPIHILYVTIFLLYNATLVAAFSEPDYRDDYMMLLTKLILAGYGAIALARIARRPALLLMPFLARAQYASPASDKSTHGLTTLAVALAGTVAVCVAWGWYMMAHTL